MMIETNETGDNQIKELLEHQRDPVFNDWEKGFIRDLAGKKYEGLTKNQKSVITRLIGWLRGEK